MDSSVRVMCDEIEDPALQSPVISHVSETLCDDESDDVNSLVLRHFSFNKLHKDSLTVARPASDQESPVFPVWSIGRELSRQQTLTTTTCPYEDRSHRDAVVSLSVFHHTATDLDHGEGLVGTAVLDHGEGLVGTAVLDHGEGLVDTADTTDLDHGEGLVGTAVLDHGEGLVGTAVLDHGEGLVGTAVLDHGEGLVDTADTTDLGHDEGLVDTADTTDLGHGEGLVDTADTTDLSHGEGLVDTADTTDLSHGEGLVDTTDTTDLSHGEGLVDTTDLSQRHTTAAPLSADCGRTCVQDSQTENSMDREDTLHNTIALLCDRLTPSERDYSSQTIPDLQGDTKPLPTAVDTVEGQSGEDRPEPTAPTGQGDTTAFPCVDQHRTEGRQMRQNTECQLASSVGPDSVTAAAEARTECNSQQRHGSYATHTCFKGRPLSSQCVRKLGSAHRHDGQENHAGHLDTGSDRGSDSKVADGGQGDHAQDGNQTGQGDKTELPPENRNVEVNSQFSNKAQDTSEKPRKKKVPVSRKGQSLTTATNNQTPHSVADYRETGRRQLPCDTPQRLDQSVACYQRKKKFQVPYRTGNTVDVTSVTEKCQDDSNIPVYHKNEQSGVALKTENQSTFCGMISKLNAGTLQTENESIRSLSRSRERTIAGDQDKSAITRRDNAVSMYELHRPSDGIAREEKDDGSETNPLGPSTHIDSLNKRTQKDHKTEDRESSYCTTRSRRNEGSEGNSSSRAVNAALCGAACKNSQVTTRGQGSADNVFTARDDSDLTLSPEGGKEEELSPSQNIPHGEKDERHWLKIQNIMTAVKTLSDVASQQPQEHSRQIVTLEQLRQVYERVSGVALTTTQTDRVRASLDKVIRQVNTSQLGEKTALSDRVSRGKMTSAEKALVKRQLQQLKERCTALQNLFHIHRHWKVSGKIVASSPLIEAKRIQLFDTPTGSLSPQTGQPLRQKALTVLQQNDRIKQRHLEEQAVKQTVDGGDGPERPIKDAIEGAGLSVSAVCWSRGQGQRHDRRVSLQRSGQSPPCPCPHAGAAAQDRHSSPGEDVAEVRDDESQVSQSILLPQPASHTTKNTVFGNRTFSGPTAGRFQGTASTQERKSACEGMKGASDLPDRKTFRRGLSPDSQRSRESAPGLKNTNTVCCYCGPVTPSPPQSVLAEPTQDNIACNNVSTDTQPPSQTPESCSGLFKKQKCPSVGNSVPEEKNPSVNSVVEASPCAERDVRDQYVSPKAHKPALDSVRHEVRTDVQDTQDMEQGCPTTVTMHDRGHHDLDDIYEYSTEPPPTENTQPPPTENTQPPPTGNTQPSPTGNTQPSPTRNTQPSPTENTQPSPTGNTQPPSTENAHSTQLALSPKTSNVVQTTPDNLPSESADRYQHHVPVSVDSTPLSATSSESQPVLQKHCDAGSQGQRHCDAGSQGQRHCNAGSQGQRHCNAGSQGLPQGQKDRDRSQFPETVDSAPLLKSSETTQNQSAGMTDMAGSDVDTVTQGRSQQGANHPDIMTVSDSSIRGSVTSSRLGAKISSSLTVKRSAHCAHNSVDHSVNITDGASLAKYRQVNDRCGNEEKIVSTPVRESLPSAACREDTTAARSQQKDPEHSHSHDQPGVCVCPQGAHTTVIDQTGVQDTTEVSSVKETDTSCRCVQGADGIVVTPTQRTGGVSRTGLPPQPLLAVSQGHSDHVFTIQSVPAAIQHSSRHHPPRSVLSTELAPTSSESQHPKHLQCPTQQSPRNSRSSFPELQATSATQNNGQDAAGTAQLSSLKPSQERTSVHRDIQRKPAIPQDLQHVPQHLLNVTQSSAAEGPLRTSSNDTGPQRGAGTRKKVYKVTSVSQPLLSPTSTGTSMTNVFPVSSRQLLQRMGQAAGKHAQAEPQNEDAVVKSSGLARAAGLQKVTTTSPHRKTLHTDQEKAATNRVKCGPPRSSPMEIGQLLQAGLLQPGTNNLSLRVSGRLQLASIVADGRVQDSGGLTFSSLLGWYRAVTGTSTSHRATAFREIRYRGEALADLISQSARGTERRHISTAPSHIPTAPSHIPTAPSHIPTAPPHNHTAPPHNHTAPPHNHAARNTPSPLSSTALPPKAGLHAPPSLNHTQRSLPSRPGQQESELSGSKRSASPLCGADIFACVRKVRLVEVVEVTPHITNCELTNFWAADFSTITMTSTSWAMVDDWN